jgi:hypothetical protein
MGKTHNAIPDLWTLVRGTPEVDPNDLLAAVDQQLHSPNPNHRTRMLMRESLLALQQLWGQNAVEGRLSPQTRNSAKAILSNDPGETGFPTLGKRMRERTDSATILTFLRELGSQTREPTRIEIGGSTSLILNDLLRRGTDDIDIVNEVPAILRSNHQLLEDLATRHGLMLAHFQSHYLPEGYQGRVHYLDRFGSLDVYLVDPLDIFVGKLFSKRSKDLDDLRMLLTKFSRDEIVDRLKSAGGPLLGDENFCENARRNWYILFGDSLPA